MELQRYTDPFAFRDDIDEYLRANLSTCNQLFVNTRSLTPEQVRDRQAWLVRLHRAGKTCGVAVVNTMPPIRTVSMSVVDDQAVVCIAEALRTDGIEPNGVFGSVQSAGLLATLLGLQARELVRMGNHVLDSAPVIVDCPGRMRAATRADLDLLVAWEMAFVVECGLPDNRSTLPAEIRERLEGPVAVSWLWEVEDVPVSMALGRPSEPVARIGMVYTPPAYRGRGYAGVLVGCLSADLQARGCTSVFLSTDLANPTSNGVYRRIGYRYLDEFTLLDVS